MPRYFFHTADENLHLDREGTELIDAHAAQVAAARAMSDMLQDRTEELHLLCTVRVAVTDNYANLLFLVTAVGI
jgi:hypothetical protein